MTIDAHADAAIEVLRSKVLDHPDCDFLRVVSRDDFDIDPVAGDFHIRIADARFVVTAEEIRRRLQEKGLA